MPEFLTATEPALALTRPSSHPITQIAHMLPWLGRLHFQPEAPQAMLRLPLQAFPLEAVSATFMHSPATNSLLSIREFTFAFSHEIALLIPFRYFANHNPPYAYYSSLNGTLGANGGIYNRIGRGFPDVSAVGDNAALVVEGFDTLEGGTSMSAPLVAAIFTRINEERLNVGKSPIGFANPTLYANPQIFNDITIGDQSLGGCGTNGFSCVPGWDPVTGLGTPKYAAWLEVFLALP